MPRGGRRQPGLPAFRDLVAPFDLPFGPDDLYENAERIPLGHRSPCAACGEFSNGQQMIRALHKRGAPRYCQDCWSLFVQAFLPVQERHITLDSYYKRTYGIGMAEYGDLYLTQGGSCAICLGKPTRPLFIDHDHETGAVRGLLCNRCNLGLGSFKDNIASLARAIAYLAK